MENKFVELPLWFRGYFAGMLDSEGCIDVQKIVRPSYCYWYPRLRVSTTDFPAMQSVYNIIGVGTFNIESKGNKKKDSYTIGITEIVDVYLLLEVIRQYLFIKRKHAELLTEFCELALTKRITDHDKQRIYEELHKLNQKGGKQKQRR